MNEKEKIVPLKFIIFFIIMMGGIIAGAYNNYSSFRENRRLDVEHQLATVADLKISGLTGWYNERRGDGELIYKNRAFTALYRRFYTHSADKKKLTSWLKKIHFSYGYENILLTDRLGNIQLVIADKTGVSYQHLKFYIAEADAKSGVTLTDFHAGNNVKSVHLSVIIPVIDENTGINLGFVLMIINPENYLYPLLKQWPVPSETAETLLVKRDGESVLFLNELRFRSNSAMNLRVPLIDKNLPAAAAVNGAEGKFQGIDYRGVEVISELRKVPGTSWHMIVKEDLSEVYGPVEDRFRIMLVIILAFTTATGLGIGFLWRRQSETFYREKYRLSETLERSDAQYRELVQNANSVIIRWKSSGEIVFFNEYAQKFFGYTAEEVAGKHVNIIIPEKESQDRDLSTLSADIAENPEKFEKYINENICKDGRRVWLVWTNKPVYNENGELVEILTIGTDITEHKHAEENLMKARERYSISQKVGHVGNWEYDIKSDSFWASEEGKRIYGFDPDDVRFSTDMVENCIPERDKVHQALVDLIEQDKEYNMEFEIHPVNSEKPKVIWSIAEVQRDDNGDPLTVTGVIVDVTERKKVEEKMKVSELKFRRLFESLQDGILILDGETGLVVDANPFFTDLTGYTREELIGKDLRELGFLKDIARSTESFSQLLRKEYIRYEDIPLETKNGKILKVEFISNVFAVDKEKVVQCTIRDISERKRAEEELKNFSAELERSNIELQQFAYVASHDLQEPLRMISSYLQLIEKRYKNKLDADADDFINFAVDGAGRMQSLINALLEFSRVSSRGRPFELVSLKEILDNICETMSPHIKNLGASVEYADLPEVKADKSQIYSVFMNLIQNALKFTVPGRAPHIIITAEKKGDDYIFCISDNGIGIEEQYFERIFTIFQRLHTQEEYSGTGIGLSICRRIVERHGGQIRVESEYGRGSSFYFNIPPGDK